MKSDKILASRIVIVAEYNVRHAISQYRIRCDCEHEFKRKSYVMTKASAIVRTTAHSVFNDRNEPVNALDTLHVVLRIGDHNGGYTMPKKHNSSKHHLGRQYTIAFIKDRNDAGLCLTPLAWDTPAARKIMAEINKKK